MVPWRLLQRRCVCNTTSGTAAAAAAAAAESHREAWSVKQVTKSNFTDTLLEDLKNQIRDSDFIAISSHTTGSSSSSSVNSWRRVLPFLDTHETAYLKAKDAAERFQLLHLMVCPFSLHPPTSTSNTKLVAHPYNFHLFPRDELNIGMPSYSFSCQTSTLTSMARGGFDFNVCIYDVFSLGIQDCNKVNTYKGRKLDTKDVLMCNNCGARLPTKGTLGYTWASNLPSIKCQSKIRFTDEILGPHCCFYFHNLLLYNSSSELPYGLLIQDPFDHAIGISYLSRAQESSAKHRLGNPISDVHSTKPLSTPSVADALFAERVKSRVRHWRLASKDQSDGANEVLIRSLKKLILGVETYGSRPCMNVDVCNERQVQLVLETLKDFSDDLVPLIIPDKGGRPKSVRVVLTSSKEDKNLLERELQDLEDKQNKKVRGFREVIDIISASQKPIVTYNCLNEFSFIHSKFIGPLPSSMSEFMCSLHGVFPHILDVNHLLKEIVPLKSARSVPAAISYLKRWFFAPLDTEISHQAPGKEDRTHGLDVLFTAYLFSKLSSVLKLTPDTRQCINGNLATSVYDFANIFGPCSTNLQELIDEDNIWMNNSKKVYTKDLIFLWGFRSGISAGVLKSFLRGTHDVFLEDFEVRLVEKSCAIVVFSKPSLAETLLKVMGIGANGYDGLREFISDGLTAAGYEAYKKVCESGFGEIDLADSLDKVLAEHQNDLMIVDAKGKLEEVDWCGDLIKLDEL